MTMTGKPYFCRSHLLDGFTCTSFRSISIEIRFATSLVFESVNADHIAKCNNFISYRLTVE